MRRRFKRRCVVVGGPNQQGQADCDRCVFETSLVRSAKEQVGSLIGGRLYTVARQRGTEHVAN